MEVWKDIEGYEGLYQASTYGRIRSLDRRDCRGNRIKGTIIKPRSINSGYFIVHIRDRNGKRKGALVHRLVALTFIEQHEGKTQVDHIDENKKNNAVENLRWATPKENTNHGTGIKRAAMSRSKPVKQMTDDGLFLRAFSSSAEAHRQTGASQGAISSCCKGKQAHAGGYRWAYV